MADRDQDQKADAGKSNPLLLLQDLSEELGDMNRVLDYGVAKYGKRGGWKVVDVDRYEQAALRHTQAYLAGAELDDESGLPHLAHAAINLMFVSWLNKARG